MYLAENLKYLRIRHKLTQEALAKELNVNRVNVAKWETGTMPQKDALGYLSDYFKVSPSALMYENIGDNERNGRNVSYEDTNQNRVKPATGDELSRQKAFGDKEDGGLIYVPVAAQAGYTRSYTDPVFVNELQRIYLPGLPFTGEDYRIFEVAGDSMEYFNEKNEQSGLPQGVFVIAERIEPNHWDFTNNYYIHVIVTQDQILIKRLFRKENNDEYVLISDNSHYKQSILKKADIKELWLVKRKIDWMMPPPRRIEIEV